MTPHSSSLQACHNCRRRRWKCDRSLPHCLKCTNTHQQCLGYQRLLRWGQGVASRGRLAGKQLPCEDATVSSSFFMSPTDPLVQDMSYASRKYLFYFASDVCRDLVLYDVPQQNHFRDLIPMTHWHPVLIQIIIANSALHMSNTYHKSMLADTSSSCSSSTSSAIQHSEYYRHALAAKQRALRLLKSALANITSMDIDVTLAVVLLFIQFELIDSGQDNWKYHVDGARTIIRTFCGPSMSEKEHMSPLRSWLISNCLVYVSIPSLQNTFWIDVNLTATSLDILGSTLTGPTSFGPHGPFAPGAAALLRDAEGNHCSSMPADLLQIMQTGTQLSQPDDFPCPPSSSDSKRRQAFLLLLHTAQSFNPLAWAQSLESRSPAPDILQRTRIASAHRAAVCIYLSRLLLSCYPAINLFIDLESLVSEVILHLSFILPSDALFAATAWPAFIAGAETNDRQGQKWAARRLGDLWEAEPWGFIKGALGVLERIWNSRQNRVTVGGQGHPPKDEKLEENWIRDLKASGVDWLIL